MEPPTSEFPAGGDLFPAVYDELRRLAAARLAAEAPGHTLDATALVHEAYLRLTGERRGSSPPPAFANKAHFFAAAAEAMRRILIDHARGKARVKRGGGRRRVELADVPAPALPPDDLLALDDALTRLAAEDPAAAAVANLVLFGGLSVEEAAAAAGTSRATAYRNWTYARAWLRDALGGESGNP